jgi:hypothetical protein
MLPYNLFYISLLGLASYVLVQYTRTYVVIRRFKREHGCLPCHAYPQWDKILGYSIYKKQVRAHKSRKLLESNHKRFLEQGETFSFHVMGRKLTTTIDPENVKAVLATNFQDFGLGHRLASMGPLLGRGIFTVDGKAWEHSRVGHPSSSPHTDRFSRD